MTMKRNIFIAILCLMASAGLQAQVISNLDGEKIDVEKLVKIVFDVYGNNNGEDILLIFESGDTLTFDIDDIPSFSFAPDIDAIGQIEQAGHTAIVYDAATTTVHIVNAGEEGVIRLFNAEGRLVKSVKGRTMTVADLVDGLYVVSYNQKLNVKIVKK